MADQTRQSDLFAKNTRREHLQNTSRNSEIRNVLDFYLFATTTLPLTTSAHYRQYNLLNSSVSHSFSRHLLLWRKATNPRDLAFSSDDLSFDCLSVCLSVCWQSTRCLLNYRRNDICARVNRYTIDDSETRPPPFHFQQRRRQGGGRATLKQSVSYLELNMD